MFLVSFVAVSVPCLFFAVPWVGLWSVIVIIPGHTHLFSLKSKSGHIESHHGHQRLGIFFKHADISKGLEV